MVLDFVSAMLGLLVAQYWYTSRKLCQCLLVLKTRVCHFNTTWRTYYVANKFSYVSTLKTQLEQILEEISLCCRSRVDIMANKSGKS